MRSGVLKIVPLSPTSAASGQQMFNHYCASCHGKDGQGNGPAATALKKAPADLTSLAARNNGAYPELKVMQSITGEGAVVAHGSSDMPVWGDVLKSLDGHSATTVKLRLANLTAYVESLQKK